VRGGVRFTSSARRTFVNTEPGPKTSSPICVTILPVTFSGVVCWRELHARERDTEDMLTHVFHMGSG